jgi:hypothetical protein
MIPVQGIILLEIVLCLMNTGVDFINSRLQMCGVMSLTSLLWTISFYFYAVSYYDFNVIIVLAIIG